MPNQGMLGLLEGLGGAILGIIVTLVIRHRESQRRILTYRVELLPVLKARQGFDNRIQVRYGDVLVDKLYSCRVVTINNGNVPLSNQPLLIKLNEGVTVLEERFETRPALEFGEIRPDEEASSEWMRRYKVELINPGDEIAVDLTVAGDLVVSDITVAARGRGLKCLPEDYYASQQFVYKVIRRVMIGMLGIGFLATFIGLVFEASLPSSWVRVIDVMATFWNGIVPAVLGYAFSLLIARWQTPRKRLSYEGVSPRPVFTTLASYRRKVGVEYMGRPAKDLYTCRVVLRNAGNRSLENQDVLVWLRGARILDASVHTEPELGSEPIRSDHECGRDRIKYRFSELEPKDKVTFDFIFEGKITFEDIQVAARGEGLEVVTEREVSNLVALRSAVVILVLLLNLLGLSALFILPMALGINVLRELGYLIYEWFLRISAHPGFRSGFAFGVVGFAVVAFLVFRIQIWWGQVTAIFKPLKVTHTTSATPAQVASGSCRAVVMGFLVFAFVMCVLIGILFPGTLERMFHALGLQF